jgi:hypothetical protein
VEKVSISVCKPFNFDTFQKEFYQDNNEPYRQNSKFDRLIERFGIDFALDISDEI